MKISISGILLSFVGGYAALFVGMIPPILLFPHALRSVPVLLYVIALAVCASLFQGYLLARIAGPEKFPLSAIICAGINSAISFSSNGFLGACLTFAVSLMLLYFGRSFLKSS